MIVLSAKEMMNQPIVVSNDATIGEVLKKFLRENKSRFIIEGPKSGIVTEKDISLFLLSDDSKRKLDEIHVTEVMRPVIAVDENTTVSECAKIMLLNGIGSLGIKTAQAIIGIITKTDLTKYYATHFVGKKLVGEYMSPYYAWQYQDATLNDIIKKMIDDKISRIIIRDSDETPVGIITFRDLFRLSLEQGEETNVLDNSDPVILVFTRKGFLSSSGFGGSTKASDVMSTNIITVNYDDDLAKTAKMLFDKNINGAGVISSHGNLIGIISKTDIVKALAYS